MALRDIKWGFVATIFMGSLVMFGLGVSLGRHFPNQQAEETNELGRRLSDVCTGQNSEQSRALCEIIFATHGRINEGSISREEDQSQRDAQFLNSLSDIISCPSHITAGACPLPYLRDFQTCPAAVSALFKAKPEKLPGALSQSRVRRILSTAGSLSEYLWKFVLASIAFSLFARVASARYVFALWACIPSIWFFNHAPWYLIWIWYGLSTAATADLRWNIPVPRTIIFIYLCVFSIIFTAWQAFKNSWELQLYWVLFLAVAVPLEPAFDFLVSKIPMPNTND
ncbi:hypothetical protein BKA66DRAFT_554673 [Pyrenochaeta sp. MPI-SDFR-AT-0127]|nr:hypothetical protein BKA66DRAFT_554673 [Pyrenochaeta sp. MPI-SDFR-AT-0127]